MTNRIPTGRFDAALTLLATTLAFAVAPAFADQIVYFSNGKAMTVKTVEKGPKFTVLEVEGGGRIGVPTDQITRIEEVEAPTPQAPPAAAPAGIAPVPPAAAPQAVVPAGTRPAIPPSPGAPPLAAPAALGSGFGGRASEIMNQLKPIEVGGGAAAPAAPAPRPQAGPLASGPGRGIGPGGAMMQPLGGRRFGGPMAGGGRGIGRRPRPDLSQLQPQPPQTTTAPAAPAPSPTPAAATGNGAGDGSAAESAQGAGNGSDDANQEPAPDDASPDETASDTPEN